MLGLGLELDGSEHPYFDAEERRALRHWDWVGIPVFGDLVWDRTRSRLLSTLIFTLVGLAAFLQVFLPQLSIGPLSLPRISTCADAGRLLGDAAAASASTAQLDASFTVFLVLAALAVVPWNPPIFLPLGAAAATGYAAFSIAVDARFCGAMAASARPLLLSQFSNGVWINQVSTTVVFYNLFILAATMVCALELWRLSAVMFSALCKGTTTLWDVARPAHWPPPALAIPATPTAASQGGGIEAQGSWVSRTLAGAQGWAAETYHSVLCIVPLRHCIACLLSSVGLAVLASTISGWAILAKDQLRNIRGAVLDPSSLPADTPELIRQLLSALDQYVPAVYRNAVLGALDGTLEWVSIGSWLVCLVFFASCASSLATVARHHRDVLERYSLRLGSTRAVEGGGATAASAGAAPAAPSDASPRSNIAQRALSAQERSFLTPPPIQLQAFAIFDSTQYIAAHLVCHLLVFLIFFLLVSVIVLALRLIYLQGLGTNLSWIALVIANLGRSQIYELLLFKLPPIIHRYVIVPLYAWCGWEDRASPWFRRVTGLFCLGTRWLDGPHVLHPRLFLLADAVFSFSLGPLMGIVDAITRLISGSVWGLLKISFLYEPVIPLRIAGFDKPYMSYG